MKIINNSAATIAFLTCSLIVSSCTNDVETDINVDPAGNAICFAPSVGHTTRATETKITNLGDFAVVARGMHHDGVLYDNFLIGSTNAGEIAYRTSFAPGENPTSGTWKLKRSVYWPSALEKVLFFAYTTLKDGETYTAENVLGVNATDPQPVFGFTGDNPYINNYKPLKADLRTNQKNGIWADGENQKDLLVAFTQQAKSVSPTNVNINFEHALTQVSITAKQEGKENTDNRLVKIKGAWIVNATEGGNLETTCTVSEDKNVNVTNKWDTSKFGKTAYGAFYKDILTLDDKNPKDILRHSLMVVPEKLEAWNKKDGVESTGSYILLLCRVELQHNGDNHDGNANLDDVATDNAGHHYHQLFPVNEEKYNGAEYGFVCVPLSSDWDTKGVGKHYTYNLNICGNGTGAGLYPPTMQNSDVNKLVPTGTKVTVVGNSEPQTLQVVTARPSGKNVGNPVLDEPIQFTVTVSGWDDLENSEWTDGTGAGTF